MENKNICLIHANIITMEGTDFSDGYLVIRDGKIADLGAMADMPQQTAGDEVIDAKGAVLTPGLIDAHSHLGMWEDGLNFEGDDGNEDTDPATPQLRALDGVNPQDRAFLEAVHAGVTTVITGPGSANPIGGQLLAMKTAGICADDMLLRAPIGIKAAFGENPKSVYHDKSQAPVTRMGTAAVIRETLQKAKNYLEQIGRAEEDEDEERPEWDFKCEALLPLLRREIPLHAHAHRLDDIFTAIRIAKEFSLRLILVHGTEAHLAADRLAREKVPVLSGPILTDRSKPELKNQSEAAPAILHAAGIETALITDHPETPEKYLLLCAAAAVRAGLDPDAALSAVTRMPAMLCDIVDRVGSLKVGKDADLVLWEGKPPAFDAKPVMVFVDGKRISG